MSTVRILNDENGIYYNVNFDLQSSLLSDGSGDNDYFIIVSTTIKDPVGASLPNYYVRTLSDLPPGGSPVTNFTDLMKEYIDYYISQSTLGQSSSSSSISSLSSSTSSSSSSSSSSNSSSSSSNSSSLSSSSSVSSESSSSSSP